MTRPFLADHHLRRSPCCHAMIGASLMDGELVGSCAECDQIVVKQCPMCGGESLPTMARFDEATKRIVVVGAFSCLSCGLPDEPTPPEPEQPTGNLAGVCWLCGWALGTRAFICADCRTAAVERQQQLTVGVFPADNGPDSTLASVAFAGETTDHGARTWLGYDPRTGAEFVIILDPEST
jgi:hypothetical protein